MSFYEAIQLITAAGVLIFSVAVGNYRGGFWVAAIVLDLAISTAAWAGGIPYAAAVGASCDFLLCLSLYQVGRSRWERWIFLLYQFSMLCSVFYLGTMIWMAGFVNHDTYSTILEAVNYAALVLIATISGYHIASDNRDSIVFRPWRRVDFLVLPAFRENAPKD